MTDDELTHAMLPLRALATHGAASAPTLYQDQAQTIVAAFDALTAEVTAMRAVVEAARAFRAVSESSNHVNYNLAEADLFTALAALDSPRSPPEPTERNEG